MAILGFSFFILHAFIYMSHLIPEDFGRLKWNNATINIINKISKKWKIRTWTLLKKISLRSSLTTSFLHWRLKEEIHQLLSSLLLKGGRPSILWQKKKKVFLALCSSQSCSSVLFCFERMLRKATNHSPQHFWGRGKGEGSKCNDQVHMTIFRVL